jgi:HEAT repeat protein
VVRALPPHPSLEHLKGQAKALLQALKQGDPKAKLRFGRCFDVGATPLDSFRLTQAQVVLAREQGFSSWRQLSAWVTDSRLPSEPEQLVQLLGARTFRVRVAAERALASTGAAGITATIAGLADPNPHVRRGAAGFMGHHADAACVPKLVDLALHDPVPYVRRTAKHAFEYQRCKPEPLDLDFLPILAYMAKTDEDWKARRDAVGSIMQLVPDPRVKEVLRYVAEHDPDQRIRWQASLGLRRDFRSGPAHTEEAKLRAAAAKQKAERQAVGDGQLAPISP